MKLSNPQRMVLNEMGDDWLLIQGKVKVGRQEVVFLRKVINDSPKVQKVSATTFKSLLYNGLIVRDQINDPTWNLFRMTDKAKKNLSVS